MHVPTRDAATTWSQEPLVVHRRARLRRTHIPTHEKVFCSDFLTPKTAQLSCKKLTLTTHFSPSLLLGSRVNRARTGTEVAASCKSMQVNSDTRVMIPGNRCCIDDYVQLQAMSFMGLRRHSAAAASLQELGSWVQGREASKVRHVKETLKKNVVQKLIKRRYIPLVLTAFPPRDLSFHMHACMPP